MPLSGLFDPEVPLLSRTRARLVAPDSTEGCRRNTSAYGLELHVYMQMLYSPLRVLAAEDADVVCGPAVLCEGALPRWCTLPYTLPYLWSPLWQCAPVLPASSTTVLLRSTRGGPPRLSAAR